MRLPDWWPVPAGFAGFIAALFLIGACQSYQEQERLDTFMTCFKREFTPDYYDSDNYMADWIAEECFKNGEVP